MIHSSFWYQRDVALLDDNTLTEGITDRMRPSKRMIAVMGLQQTIFRFCLRRQLG